MFVSVHFMDRKKEDLPDIERKLNVLREGSMMSKCFKTVSRARALKTMDGIYEEQTTGKDNLAPDRETAVPSLV